MSLISRQTGLPCATAEKANRKVAIMLANYPNRDGRIANGVGYDTPASTIAMVNAMQGAGYDVGEFPESGNDLIQTLSSTRSCSCSPWRAIGVG